MREINLNDEIKNIEENIKKFKGKKRNALLRYYDILVIPYESRKIIDLKIALAKALKSISYKVRYINDPKLIKDFEKNLKEINEELYTQYKKDKSIEKFAKSLLEMNDEYAKIEKIIKKLRNINYALLGKGENLKRLSLEEIRNINGVEDLWMNSESEGYEFMHAVILSPETEEKLCNYFDNKFAESFGKEKIDYVINRKIEKLNNEEINFLLKYPNDLISYIYEYLIENNIYRDLYYERAFYHANLIGDFPSEMATEYVIKFSDRGRKIFEDFILTRGYLHLDITDHYLLDKENRKKYRERLYALLHGEEPLLFHGAFYAHRYANDEDLYFLRKEVMSVAEKIINGEVLCYWDTPGEIAAVLEELLHIPNLEKFHFYVHRENKE